MTVRRVRVSAEKPSPRTIKKRGDVAGVLSAFVEDGKHLLRGPEKGLRALSRLLNIQERVVNNP
jgi:hypothetical protein